MKLKIKHISSKGSEYFEVTDKLMAEVNAFCDEMGDNPNTEVKDVRFEQSIQTYNMQVQCFYITAFIHYVEINSGNSAI